MDVYYVYSSSSSSREYYSQKCISHWPIHISILFHEKSKEVIEMVVNENVC